MAYENKYRKYPIGTILNGKSVGYTHDGLCMVKTSEGELFFIPGLIEGEEVEFTPTYVSAKASYGRTTKINKLSNDRIAPLCPVATACGGCSYQHIAYPRQLEIKKEKVINAFRTIAHQNVNIDQVIGMDEPYYYRNKTQMPIQFDKRGHIVSGFYKVKSHDIVPVDKCVIENKAANGIIATLKRLMKSMKIDPYNEDTRTGVIRHVLIRTSHHRPEIMVCLITNVDSFPSRNNLAKELVKAHPSITTVVQNINTRATNVILGEQERVLYGPGFINDDISEIRFRISSKSFFQVNPTQTEKLYGLALEKAELTGKEKVLDTYCGIGTISLLAAKQAREVIGVEVVQEAVKDARNNAKHNGINNVSFITADASDYMVEQAEKKTHFDVVIMDPPRKGSDERFLSSLIQLAPTKVVYISCDPGTLARDIKFLSSKYEVTSIGVVDMFPFTFHVETVVLLELKS